MKYLRAISDLLNRVLLVLGGLAVLGLMLLATGNVILRIFHVPYRGTYEIVSFFGAVTIACALGQTQRQKNNIVVEILSERFPPRLKGLVDGVSSLVMAVFFAIVSWQLFVWGTKIAEAGEVSETLRIIFYPFVFTVGVGFGALALTTFVDLLSLLFLRKESQRQSEIPPVKAQTKEGRT